MLAVVKTPHIDLKIQGEIPPPVLRVLKKQYGNVLQVENNNDEERVDWFSTPLHRKIAKRRTPGTAMKIYRANFKLTQKQLGEKLGVRSSYISDMEHDRRAISKDKAKLLARIFQTSPERFL